MKQVMTKGTYGICERIKRVKPSFVYLTLRGIRQRVEKLMCGTCRDLEEAACSETNCKHYREKTVRKGRCHFKEGCDNVRRKDGVCLEFKELKVLFR